MPKTKTPPKEWDKGSGEKIKRRKRVLGALWSNRTTEHKQYKAVARLLLLRMCGNVVVGSSGSETLAAEGGEELEPADGVRDDEGERDDKGERERTKKRARTEKEEGR